MKNLIVRYEGDPEEAFSVDLIEQVKVKSWRSNTFHLSEHYGWEDDVLPERYDFGSAGTSPNVIFEIYDEFTKFFTGDPEWIEFNKESNSVQLVDQPTFDGAIKLDLRWYYKRPVTMGDFIGYIADFHNRLHKLADPVYEKALPF